MPPAPYPDFRWFFRSIRVLPVVAIAALAGGVIGGFSIFAINLAVTAPPNHSVPAEPGSKLASQTTSPSVASSPPMRTFDAATPAARPAAPVAAAVPATAAPAAPLQTTSASSAISNSHLPAVAEPTPVSAQDISPGRPTGAAITQAPSGETNGEITIVHPQGGQSSAQAPQQQAPSSSQAAVAPPQQTSWPDALTREHKAAPNTAAATSPTAVTAAQPAPVTNAPQTNVSADDRAVSSAPSAQTAQKPTAPESLKRRVAIKRAVTPHERNSASVSGNSRPLYDYSRQDESSRQDEYSRHDDQNAGRDPDRTVADDHMRAKYSTTRYPAKKYHTKPQDDARRQPLDIAPSSARADNRLYDRSDGRDDQRDDQDDGYAVPAQPAPPPLPFFGLFGGGDRD